MPTTSSRMPWTSVGPNPSAKPPASRSKPSLHTWPTGPRKTATLCSASSTATPEPRKVQHEALFRVSSPCGCVGDSFGSGRDIPSPGGSGPESLAQTETLLRDSLRCPQAQASHRVRHDRPPVLHTQGYVEAELVPARFRLRRRAARKERDRRKGPD